MVNGKPRPANRRMIWVKPNDISRRMHRTEHARGGSVGCANSENHLAFASLALPTPQACNQHTPDDQLVPVKLSGCSRFSQPAICCGDHLRSSLPDTVRQLSLIHISEPT